MLAEGALTAHRLRRYQRAITAKESTRSRNANSSSKVIPASGLLKSVHGGAFTPAA
jgi:hypothetical protein